MAKKQTKKTQNNPPNPVRPSRKTRRNKTRQVVRYVERQAPPRALTLGDIGQWAGNSISKIFGLGAYSLKKNTVMDSISQQVPFMHSSTAEVRLCNREFICDVSSSTNFQNNVFPLEASNSMTFPYLSTLALNFQEYKFEGLVFEFKSTSASALNSTNTALGTVMMACQYDVTHPPFDNKQTVLNSMWSADSKPSESFLLPIECDPKERPFETCLVRRQATTVTDPHVYSWGNLNVATTGSQAAATIGELWVSYDVKLMKPAQNESKTSYSIWYPGLVPTDTLRFQNMTLIGTTVESVGQQPHWRADNVLVIPPNGMKWYTMEYLFGAATASTGGWDRGTETYSNAVPYGPMNFTAPEHGASAYNTWRSLPIEIVDTTKECVITFDQSACAVHSIPYGANNSCRFILTGFNEKWY